MIELRRGATLVKVELAVGRGGRLRCLDARAAAVIRVDAVWLAVEPLDMRAGTETALARVVRVFGEARAHHAYLFANRRATGMKVLVHDGIGIWLCARRLHQGRFVWASAGSGCAADDQPRAVAGAGDRIAVVAHRRTGDDSRRVKMLLSCDAMWQHRVACKCTINLPRWTRSNCANSPPA